jgi:hypothetical protein
VRDISYGLLGKREEAQPVMLRFGGLASGRHAEISTRKFRPFWLAVAKSLTAGKSRNSVRACHSKTHHRQAIPVVSPETSM